ncbi:MAG: bifunctional salicylyl-CoA 5-hydroxylase/oxidoreductase [Gammaproteobacteria bacterium]|nr:bifunctional salicylyl-CoA 5-hydroxylase/oxidoreductase [Gammaproteobacteria bacterium]
MNDLKIVCLGGGPASLYFSLLMKKANPGHEITVIERGPRDATWGFGVVFSDDTLHGFMEADAPSYKRIVEQFAYWDKIETRIHGAKVISGGHGFCGMSRLKLLNALHDRCEGLGVNLRFNTDITDLAQLDIDGHDLVVAGDGITSMLRTAYEREFGTMLDWRSNRFCWLATTLPLDSFIFIFRRNEHGWWWVHGYRYEEGMSTWIVECSHEAWMNAGMDTFSEDDTRSYIEEVFREDLQGHPIITNRSLWREFPVVGNDRLYHKNIVLLGDAGRSAHFSIGSGTKLAMEDAISLADIFRQQGNRVNSVLEEYQKIRKPEADRLQRTAVTSLHWFENIGRYARQDAEQFTFNMMVRSKRVTYDNLRLRDPGFIRSIDKWFAGHTRKVTGYDDIDTENPDVPMFQPFRIGRMRVENRVQLSAMCQYCATDGMPDEWHFVHYGSRGIGGAGIVSTEMLCTSADGRITTGCAGIWNARQTEQWRRITAFIHAHSKAKVCGQIGHAGRKGATCIPWQGGIDEPMPEQAWEIIAPSPLPYLQHSRTPRGMSGDDMDRVEVDFLNATSNAVIAGFDMLEIHMAHGYLLSSFISPYTNRRADEYGGDIKNRARFPLRILRAVRQAWPPERPISIRISATDWITDGLSEGDLSTLVFLLRDNGADIINVSTGQVVSHEEPVYGRMYQAPFADRIRNEMGIPTIVAGNITSADQVNTLVAAGRTDLVALARPIMNEPQFVLNAAARYGYKEQHWPEQYGAGKFAAELKAARDNEEEIDLRTAAKPPNPEDMLAVAIARGEVLLD